MKQFYILVTAFGAMFIQAQDCTTTMPANLKTGVLAYYPFSDGSTNDFSGNGHHLSNTGANSASDRNGNINCSYSFNNSLQGNDFYLSCADATFLNSLTQFSVSCWYNVTGGNQGSHRSMVSRDYAPACPDRSGQWSIGVYDGHRAVFGRQNSVWQNWAPGFNPLNVWQHVTATYNQTGQTIKLYINGILQSTQTGTAGCGASPVIVSDIGSLFIGKRFTGMIDDILIYNREVTAAEALQLYNLGTCCLTETLAAVEYKPIEFMLTPNPVKNLLTISAVSAFTIQSISIYNTIGQLMMDFPDAKNAKTIDISSLSAGNYFIRVQSDNGSATNKFIKN